MTRHLIPALILGFLLRAGFGLLYWVDKPLTHDEQEYLMLGRNLAAGNGLTYDADSAHQSERFGRAPLYPVFLAGVIRIAGGETTRESGGTERPGTLRGTRSLLTSVKTAQAVVGTIGIWLIGLLAATSGGRSAGSAAVWIAAVYPPLVWICAYALSEALYSTLALAGALLLGAAIDSTRWNGVRRLHLFVLAAGIISGLAALTRPAGVCFVLVAAGWLLIRRHLGWFIIFILGAAVAIGPWTARNLREHGRFVLIASEGGVTFWTGNHPLARGEGDLAANPDIKRAHLAFRQAHPSMSPEQLEPVYYAEALRYIGANPVDWLILTLKKFFYLWVPMGPSYRLHSPRYFWTSVLSYGIVFPLALLGFLRIRRLRVQPRAMWLLAGSAILVCLVFFPQERFRIPVIDPALIACAAVWLAEVKGKR